MTCVYISFILFFFSESNDTKSVSAKTITLRSNGTAKSVEGTEPAESKAKISEGKDKGTAGQPKGEPKVRYRSLANEMVMRAEMSLE